MQLSTQLAKHLREVFFGGNWTYSNLKQNLTDVTWQQATNPVQSCNTIVALTYHISYFVSAVLDVFNGKPLAAHDKFSFDHPPVTSHNEWQALLDKTFSEAEQLAALVEQLPDNKWWEDFTDKKYGNYYRNIHGIIEHTHYHLGQIVVIKKMILLKQLPLLSI